MNFQERAALRSRHVTIPFCLPLTLVEVIDRYTESLSLDPANKVNTSKVTADLIRDGLRFRAQQKSLARHATTTVRYTRRPR